MLVEMLIRNFVLIDELRLEFGEGLNVLTGETGAGKSILIDALGLITGERIRDDYLRDRSQKALVEATFDMQDQNRAIAYLQEQGLYEDGEELAVVSREIAPTGRSTARINGRNVPVSLLRDLALHMVDLHVQGEQHQFLQPENYLQMVDAFSREITPVRKQVQEIFYQLQQLNAQLEEIAAGEQNKAQRLDFLDFQISEIQKAQLRSGEDEELLAVRQRIRNAHRLAEGSQAILNDLYRSEEIRSAYDLISSALNVAQHLDEDQFFASLKVPLQEILATIQDLSSSVSSFQDELDFEPGLLDQIEERLHTIERLKSKYGSSADDILACLQSAIREREQLEFSSEKIRSLEQEIAAVKQNYDKAAAELSSLRQLSAQRLEQAVLHILGQLNMPDIRFEVRLETRRSPGSTGTDRIELYFSANPGEEMRPLSRTASGGEISRVILAIKTALADTYEVPTLIFDEIDVGVGGTSLTAMARKLKELSSSHQVILVTHAPQVAAYAAVHHLIKKEIISGQTLTRVALLQDEARVQELARMLSGESITDITLQHAREMLHNASA